MNDITNQRPTNFGQDQVVYTWNGVLKCVHCHQITQRGTCANGCAIFIGTWGQAQSGDTNSARFEETLEAEALAVQEGDLVCSRCDNAIDALTIYSLEHDAFGVTKVYCNTCTNVRTDEKIAAGVLKISAEGTIFDPRLFPEKVAVKDCLFCGGPVPEARVISKCNNCLEQIDRIAVETEADPAYQAIEEAITRGEAFQCAFCEITDDISQLDDSLAGVNRCKTCQDKHATAAANQLAPPPDPEPGKVWVKHRIHDHTQTGGQAVVQTSTNDDLDLGRPTRYSRWNTHFDTLEEALVYTGKSVQLLLQDIEVFLNGERI